MRPRKQLTLFLSVILFVIIYRLYSYKRREPVDKNDIDMEVLQQLPPMPFKYMQFNRVCTRNPPYVLVLVMSKPKNLHQRLGIRQAWALTYRDIRILFVLGSMMHGPVDKRVAQEHSIYHDLIQGDFFDGDSNQGVKNLMGFRYPIFNCDSIKYVLKVNDDVFVNAELLKNFLAHKVRRVIKKNFLMCSVVNKPLRRDGLLEVIGKTDPKFPDTVYCEDWVMLFSIDVVKLLFKRAMEDHKHSSLHFNHIYFTGMLLEDIEKVPMDRLIIWHKDRDDILKFKEGPAFAYFLVAQNITPIDMQTMQYFVRTRGMSHTLLTMNLK